MSARTKVRRQLQGFLPREGWPDLVRRAFAGRKAPPNLEVSVKDGAIRLRFHIRVDGWKDADRLLRQFAAAKSLAKVADIPVMVGEQRAVIYDERKPWMVEADFSQVEMRVLTNLQAQVIGRGVRAVIPGDGRTVVESDYQDSEPRGLVISSDPEALSKWLTGGTEGMTLHRTETGRPRKWVPADPPPWPRSKD